jgi:hypothetical protein
MRWQTDGGPLQYVQLDAPAALRLLNAMAESRKIMGVALNPFQPEEIALQPQEISKLLKGESFPMPRYIGNLAVQQGEKFLDEEPSPAPSEELIAALDSLIGGGFLSYRLRQTFNEERDLKPHLMLSVKTNLPAERHPGLAEKINGAVQNKVPPPGYLDVIFVS